MKSIVPIERVEKRIYAVRDVKVMLDKHLAALYGVSTGALNRAVKRNRDRFPADFMFDLTPEEYDSLRCQLGIIEKGRHSKYLARVFTEQGVAMLSSVLRSPRAIQVNIVIMRAFVGLRAEGARHKALLRLFQKLKRRVDGQDGRIRRIFAMMERLVGVAEKPKKPMGFRPDG